MPDIGLRPFNIVETSDRLVSLPLAAQEVDSVYTLFAQMRVPQMVNQILHAESRHIPAKVRPEVLEFLRGLVVAAVLGEQAQTDISAKVSAKMLAKTTADVLNRLLDEYTKSPSNTPLSDIVDIFRAWVRDKTYTTSS